MTLDSILDLSTNIRKLALSLQQKGDVVLGNMSGSCVPVVYQMSSHGLCFDSKLISQTY